MVEGGFGKIMLGRHDLHHAISQRRFKRHHGRGIAREGAGGEGINQEKRKVSSCPQIECLRRPRNCHIKP
jgi:hypothetical protein